jgi:hypothetical protein
LARQHEDSLLTEALVTEPLERRNRLRAAGTNGRLGLLIAGALLARCLLALVGCPALPGKGVRTRGGS